MKRLLMMFAIAVAAIACGEKSENPSVGTTSEIILSTETPLWLDSTEGIYEIAYSITNPSADLKLEADSNVDWASVIEIKADKV